MFLPIDIRCLNQACRCFSHKATSGKKTSQSNAGCLYSESSGLATLACRPSHGRVMYFDNSHTTQLCCPPSRSDSCFGPPFFYRSAGMFPPWRVEPARSESWMLRRRRRGDTSMSMRSSSAGTTAGGCTRKGRVGYERKTWFGNETVGGSQRTRPRSSGTFVVGRHSTNCGRFAPKTKVRSTGTSSQRVHLGVMSNYPPTGPQSRLLN